MKIFLQKINRLIFHFLLLHFLEQNKPIYKASMMNLLSKINLIIQNNMIIILIMKVIPHLVNLILIPTLTLILYVLHQKLNNN